MPLVPTHPYQLAKTTLRLCRRHHATSPVELLEPRCLLAADLVISEFMASNTITHKDYDKDYSDWIEIYNRGDATADLTGWHLTNSIDEPERWHFPAGRTLDAGAYVVVFASKKDKVTVTGEMHTNFKLDMSGSYLGLIEPDGITPKFEYAPEFPPQSSDVSYGISPDGSGELVYFTKPSPNGPNQLIASLPVFSQSSQAFTGALALTLSTDNSKAQIRYTLNRTAPTATSTLYTGPISITSTTMVRACVFEAGISPGQIVSQTYYALDATTQGFSSNLPVVILDSFGKGTNETTFTEVSLAIYDTGGDGYTHFTDQPVLSHRGGMKIRGQVSVGFPKKQWSFELWDERNDNQSLSVLGMPSESDWIIYGPYSEKSLMQNPLAFKWASRMGRYASRTRFVELFANFDGSTKFGYAGDYMGIYVLMEKITRNPSRVDVTPLTPTDNAEPDITGGYMWKKDKVDAGEVGFSTNSGLPWLYVEPKQNEITTQQKTYLQGYLNQFEAALYGPNFTDPVNGYAKYIDVDTFIDYHIMVEMCKQIDGYRISTYYYKDRGGKICMGPIWDYHLSMGNANYLTGETPTGWYYDQLGDGDYPYFRRLFQDPNFKQRWIDRWQELRKDEFTTDHLLGDIDEYVTLLSDGNGNYPVGQSPTQTPNNPIVRNYRKWNVLNTYLWPNAYVGKGWTDDVNWMKNYLKTRWAWMDSQSTAAPEFSQAGGWITAPVQLTITGPAGASIYYTLDGSDPRLPGGAISPKATKYTGPVAITNSTRVMARSYKSSAWSGPTDEIYAVDDGLRITEIMYHPADPPALSAYVAEDFEFVELRNGGPKAINLSGVKFTNGIDFAFPNLLLAPGQRTVVVRNLAAFQSRYGSLIPIAGTYTGNLDNGGEKIELQGAVGQVIEKFEYNDTWSPWTDGEGFSLVAVDPLASNDVLDSQDGWRSSFIPNGAPGADDVGPAPDSVVINEVLSHPSADFGDWIELANTTDAPINIGGWFLSDSADDLRKYQIPAGTIIPRYGYYVFTQADHFDKPGGPGVNTPFAFSELGDEAYLTSNYSGLPGGYRESVAFAAADRDVSFGRHTKSTGKSDFVSMKQLTPRQANADPVVASVVISEIMYNPPIGTGEYIELRNITGSAVPLYDPLHPGNVWQFMTGISYTFRTGDQIAANGFAVVVPGDPAAFRTKYSVPEYVPVFGPYTGRLSNAGEGVELYRPGVPEADGFVPYVLVERIKYDTNAPWPAEADGKGASLSRIALASYGNEPANWVAETIGSPGRSIVDRIPPKATIDPVDPDPRQLPVESITIRFDEPVVGFDRADLSLSRNAGPNLLTSAQTLTDTGDGQTFVLGNLAQLTWVKGAYALKVNAGLGITDASGNPLAQTATESFSVTDTIVRGTDGNDTFSISVASGSLRISVNAPPDAPPTFIAPLADVPSMLIEAGNGDDTLDILSVLPFLPAFNGGAGKNQLNIAAGNYTLGDDVNGLGISVSGSDAANPTTLAFDGTQHLSSLAVSGQARVSLATSVHAALFANALEIAGDAVLDMGKGDLVVQADAQTRDAVFSRMVGWIRSARADYAHLWQGPGLTTTEGGVLTGLAATINDAGDRTLYDEFGGQLVDRNAILVKYTWNGDTNLDGVVNGDDYFLIDSGFISQAVGYRNGDLNYDGVVNADDYFLIDTAFISQSAPLAASAPATAAPQLVLASPRSAQLPQTRRSSIFDDAAGSLFSSVPVAEPV